MLIVEILAALAIVYGLIALFVSLGQRRLLYVPDRRKIAPTVLGLADVREQVIETPDGERLIAWYLPAAPGKPTLLYFHGNGGGLIDRAERFRIYRELGIGLFIMSYRSYSGSTGAPTEARNIDDAELAWHQLVSLGADPESIVLYGESLGTGVALQVAARRPPPAIILEAPYSSILDIAEWRFPFLPVRRLLKDRYLSTEHAPKIRAPLLVLHGERDGIVPIRFGRKLFASANEPKQLNTYARAGHLDTYEHGAFDDIQSFLGRLSP